MSADRDAMYKTFEESPGDLAGYGAMADELDALGYEKLAHAFRWMSFRGVWPHKRTNYGKLNSVSPGRRTPKNARWAWYSIRTITSRYILTDSFPRNSIAQHALPFLLIWNHPQKTFASHQEAVMWLADRLDALRVEYAVHPPKPKGLPLIDTLDVTGIRVPPLFNNEGDNEATA